MGPILFLKHLLQRIDRDEVLGMSAELAYFFLLSLFPFLIFLLTLIAYVPISQEDVLNVIRQYAPGDTMRLIESNIVMIMNQQRGDLLSFGIIAALWFASNGINGIVRSFNKAFEVRENRSFFRARVIGMLLTIAMVFVIIVALLLPVFGREIGLFIFSSFGLSEQFIDIWNTIRWGVSFVFIFFIFCCLYYAAPNIRLRIRDVLAGSLFATAGWMTVSLLFSYYVSNFGNYSAMYGSLGGIIVLLVWFYLTGLLIILGGEINAILHKWKKSLVP